MGFFSKLFGQKDDALFAPMAGTAVPVTEVPDPTFSSGMLGDGIAIEPTDGKVLAPCDATVDTMFDTGHAVSLVADCGAEVLIHVGLETVGLQGKGFTIHAQNGQKVKKGDLLIEADLSQDLSLSALADALRISAGYLSTLFRQETGKTVTVFVDEKRMEHAAHLLQSSTLQVQTVAQYCGIIDVNYFSKLFKRYCGVTPREYRQKHTK